MMDRNKNIAIEKETLMLMIALYCRKKHDGSDNICESCRDLRDYAFGKLDKCPWGEDKPTCKKCSIHCYSPDKREQVREVMRFSGPRMILNHPLHVLRHYFT